MTDMVLKPVQLGVLNLVISEVAVGQISTHLAQTIVENLRVHK